MVTNTTNANAGLSTPYLGIGIFAAVWFLVFIFAPVPDLHAEDESKKSADQKASLKPSGGQWAGIGIALVIVWGLLYFFIAPILGLVWALLNLPANLLDPTKYGLIVVACIGSFVVVSKNWDMFRRKHFTLGVVAQFLYVAAQTGIFSFCVNYIIENDPGVTPAKAATMLGGIGFVLFTVGTLLRQRRYQPVQAPSRARGLRGHQCGADGGVHGRRQAGLDRACSARSSSCPSCSRRFLRWASAAWATTPSSARRSSSCPSWAGRLRRRSWATSPMSIRCAWALWCRWCALSSSPFTALVWQKLEAKDATK